MSRSVDNLVFCWFNLKFSFLSLQSIDSNTPKKEREDALRNQKDAITIRQREQEQVLDRQQKDSLEYEIRKFRRRRYLQHHELEQQLLRDVSTITQIDSKRDDNRYFPLTDTGMSQ